MSAYDSQEQAIARLRGRAEAAEEELEERHRLEAELAEEREAVKATERERNKMTDERNEAWDTLARVREYALDTEDDYVLALLDGEDSGRAKATERKPGPLHG